MLPSNPFFSPHNGSRIITWVDVICSGVVRHLPRYITLPLCWFSCRSRWTHPPTHFCSHIGFFEFLPWNYLFILNDCPFLLSPPCPHVSTPTRFLDYTMTGLTPHFLLVTVRNPNYNPNGRTVFYDKFRSECERSVYVSGKDVRWTPTRTSSDGLEEYPNNNPSLLHHVLFYRRLVCWDVSTKVILYKVLLFYLINY